MLLLIFTKQLWLKCVKNKHYQLIGATEEARKLFNLVPKNYLHYLEFAYLTPTCLFTRLESRLVPAGFLTSQFLQKT